MSPIDRDRIQELIEILKTSSAAEISVCEGDSFVRIRQGVEGVVVQTEADNATSSGALAAATDSPVAEPGVVPVPAKLVGIFYLARQDDSAPLVELGDQVAEGQAIGAIEALGKWTSVISPVAGEVVEIVAQEGSPIQYGDVVMRIMPAEVDQ